MSKQKTNLDDLLNGLDERKAKISYSSESMVHLTFEKGAIDAECKKEFFEKLKALSKFKKRVRFLHWPHDKNSGFMGFFMDTKRELFIASLTVSEGQLRILSFKDTEEYGEFETALLQELAEKLNLLKKA